MCVCFEKPLQSGTTAECPPATTDERVEVSLLLFFVLFFFVLLFLLLFFLFHATQAVKEFQDEADNAFKFFVSRFHDKLKIKN